MASPSPTQAILLLVDLQQGLVEGPSEWGPRSTPALTDNVSRLLSTWRAAAWPVIHVVHDDPLDNGNPISAKFPVTFATHACAAPIKDEKVFVKHVGSPFVATGIYDEIKKLGANRKVVVIGMDGSQCINNTTRHGVDLGLDMIVVGDACASYEMNDWKTGEVVSAEETHGAAMSMLKSYSHVHPTEKVIAMFGLGS